MKEKKGERARERKQERDADKKGFRHTGTFIEMDREYCK